MRFIKKVENSLVGTELELHRVRISLEESNKIEHF